MRQTIVQSTIIALALSAFACNEPNKEKDVVTNAITKDGEAPQPIDESEYSLAALDNLFERKTIKARDRSMTEYLNSDINRPDSVKKVIYLLPIGHMHSEIEQIILEDTSYYQAFFQLEVKVLPRVSFDNIKNIEQIKTRDINIGGYGGKKGMFESEVVQEQIEAKSLIDHYIVANKPKDAVAILGITDHDIYSKRYNFLYGSSSIKNGAGLISTHRIKAYRDLTQANIRKVASKQITNLFSIKNVKDYNCLLNFHNGMQELQHGVYYISPRALEKLKMNIGFDYETRFNALLDFWKAQENRHLVDHYSKCLGLEVEEVATETEG